MYSCSSEGDAQNNNPDATLDVLVAGDVSDSSPDIFDEATPTSDAEVKVTPPTYSCADGLPPVTWLVDRDGDGYFAKATVACEPPTDGNTYLTATQLQMKTGTKFPLLDCDGWDDQAAVHPYATDICDGLDNDCDLIIDEDQPSIAKPCNGGSFTFCEGLQFQYCLDGNLSEWSPCMEVVVKEFCDGKDNDCNGIVDDIEQKSCTTACGTGIEACLNGALICDYIQNDPTCCEPVGAIKDKELCPPTHYIFIVDASASTSEATAAVRDALTQFADAHEVDNVAGELGMILFRDYVEETPYGIAVDETQFKEWVAGYKNISSPEGHLNALMDAAQTFPWPASGKYHAILVSDSNFDVFGEDYDSVTTYTIEDAKTALQEKGIYLSAVQVYSYPFFYSSLFQYDDLTKDIGQHLEAADDEAVLDTILSLLAPNSYTYSICNQDHKWEYVDQCKK